MGKKYIYICLILMNLVDLELNSACVCDYYVHSRSQARKKEEGCSRLTGRLKFSQFIMNGSTTDARWSVFLGRPQKFWD